MIRIGLLSCGAQKLDRAAPARDLYTSPLFRLSLAYLEHRCDVAYVLSALHGVVELGRVLAPYDARLGGKAHRQRWARTAAGTLIGRHDRNDEVVMLAGADYASPLVVALRTYDGMRRTADGGYTYQGWRGPIVEPLARMQIGQRLSWLNANAPAVRS